jgi:hypothetical protein
VTAPENGNGRTHEPSLREVTADLDGQKVLMLALNKSLRDLMDERHNLYKERDESSKLAVKDALTAQDKLTTNAFAASKEAIAKSDNAQNSYNASHNDLLKKMDDQHKDTLPRNEANEKFKGYDEKFDNLRKDIQGLRESRSENLGVRNNGADNRVILASLPAWLVAAGAAIVYLLAHYKP